MAFTLQLIKSVVQLLHLLIKYLKNIKEYGVKI